MDLHTPTLSIFSSIFSQIIDGSTPYLRSSGDGYVPSPGTDAMPKCILIVDDSATVRTLIREFLENLTGLEVCGEAADGVDAIEKARVLRPDLIILDLAMPGMNGVEAASVLKRMLPDTRILLFTMYDESVGKSLASASRIDVVLSKPNGMRQMVECVQNLLGAA
jgi:DNA-binding NarL/FixJ family response regulator